MAMIECAHVINFVTTKYLHSVHELSAHVFFVSLVDLIKQMLNNPETIKRLMSLRGRTHNSAAVLINLVYQPLVMCPLTE
jgi:hypothetical protein